MTTTAALADAIRLADITVAYERHAAVHHVSGAFRPGSLTAIVGPNGAGKSTLVKAIVGETRVASGFIDLGGLPRSSVGYLPQVAEIDRTFPLTVADTVLLGAWRQAGAFFAVSSQLRQQGRAALAKVGLAGFDARPIGSLSVGQFRRVLFARLILQDANVIVLDEPFAALDQRTTRDLLNVIADWHDEGRTVIAVLHDLDQVRVHFPETLLMARDLIAWGTTDTVLTATNLVRAQRMSEAWDDVATYCQDGHRHVA